MINEKVLYPKKGKKVKQKTPYLEIKIMKIHK